MGKTSREQGDFFSPKGVRCWYRNWTDCPHAGTAISQCHDRWNRHRRIFHNIKESDFFFFFYYSNKFDLIVSNPPFYTEDTLGGNKARDAARHTSSLPFEKLISNAAELMTDDGFFCVIIPFQSANDFISICVGNRLYLTRRMNIRSTERKPFNRAMLEFSTSIQPTENLTLTLYDTNRQRTTEYKELTQDFYL